MLWQAGEQFATYEPPSSIWQAHAPSEVVPVSSAPIHNNILSDSEQTMYRQECYSKLETQGDFLKWLRILHHNQVRSLDCTFPLGAFSTGSGSAVSSTTRIECKK